MNKENFFTKEYKANIFLMSRAILVVALPALLFFIYIWQNINYALLNRQIRELHKKKEILVKKNDDLKVSIISYATAERVESLYKKNNEYLPIATGSRIITLALPPEVNIEE